MTSSSWPTTMVLIFFLQFQDDLFSDVPTIFCGINDFSRQLVQHRNNVTGVIESFDFKTNLELIQRYHPDRKRLIVIEDYSVTAKAIKSEMLKSLNQISDPPNLQFLKAENIDQLVLDAKALASDSVFYVIPFYMDDQQRGRHSANEIVKTLWEKTRVPIYSNWKFLLGSGIVGGKLVDGYAHGMAAARMALRVLEGERADHMPIIKPNDEVMVFDNAILEALHISRGDLPEGSNLINRTAYFFEIDRQLFWVLVGCMVVVAMGLVLLVFNIQERKRAERRLKAQLAFVRLLINTIPSPIYFHGNAGRFTGCNSAFETWFGLAHDQILNMDAHRLTDAGPGQLMDSVDKELQHEMTVRSYEKQLHVNGAGPRDVILQKASYTNGEGKIIGIVGAIHDITHRKRTERELRASRQMLQIVLDNIPQHVYWKDKDLKVLGANQSFGAFFGIKDLDWGQGQDRYGSDAGQGNGPVEPRNRPAGGQQGPGRL